MKTLKTFFRKFKTAIFFSTLIIFTAFMISTAVARDPSLRLLVDEELCFGCGDCETLAPHCFTVIDGVALPLLGWIYYPDEWEEAMIMCPSQAIYLDYY